jgi:hypothetical protein
MDPTLPPVAPLYETPTIDPWGPFFALLGAGALAYIGVIVLEVWGFYWLIRLAVRHGSMDVGRWERAGMPARMPKKASRPRGYGSGSFFSN